MKGSPSLTEISQSGDDVGPFVQTFVYPSGNLSQKLIRQEQKGTIVIPLSKSGILCKSF